jgi:hypothetical protein
MSPETRDNVMMDTMRDFRLFTRLTILIQNQITGLTIYAVNFSDFYFYIMFI